MLRVLEICAALDGGGVDHLLYELCNRIEDIHFDFVVTSQTKGVLEDKLLENGSTIYHVQQMKGHFCEYIRRLSGIMSEGHYDIVHDHMNQASMGSMFVAFKERVPVRIAHCHTRILDETVLWKAKRKLMALIAKSFATDLCACGNEPAIWMWGSGAFKKGNIHIINNAIDINRFRYNERTRDQIRELLGLNGRFVIGNVARFSKEKNHEFMIDIVATLVKQGIDVTLLLVGSGELEDAIKEYAIRSEIAENIQFLGLRNDVDALLNAMDVFILPSEYEGFPVTLVEAQANGLPIVVSDVVTKQCLLSDNISFLSLKQGRIEWANMILHLRGKRSTPDDRMENYDVNKEAKRFEEYYQSLIARGKRS